MREWEGGGEILEASYENCMTPFSLQFFFTWFPSKLSIFWVTPLKILHIFNISIIIIHQIFSITCDWSERITWPKIFQLKREYSKIFPIFENCMCCEKSLKDNKHNSSHLAWTYTYIFVLGHYLFLKAHYLFTSQIR